MGVVISYDVALMQAVDNRASVNIPAQPIPAHVPPKNPPPVLLYVDVGKHDATSSSGFTHQTRHLAKLSCHVGVVLDKLELRV